MIRTLWRHAEISPCGRFRYSLQRRFPTETIARDPGGMCCFIMLNPSTADAQVDDPTIRRCMDFAQRWGHDGIYVVNLFSYRATNPAELSRVLEVVPDGDLFDGLAFWEHIGFALGDSKLVVVAWGNHGGLAGQDMVMLDYVRSHGKTPMCLGFNSGGQPKHPLYVPGNAELVEFVWEWR